MRVVFVCHEASRTGAPLLLFELVKWLVKERGVEPYIVLLSDGPLTEQFKSIAPVFCWKTGSGRREKKNMLSFAIDVGRTYLFDLVKSRLLRRVIVNFDPQLIYVNS